MKREQNYWLVFHVSMSFTYYLGGRQKKKERKGRKGKERKYVYLFVCLPDTPPRFMFKHPHAIAQIKESAGM
jgi:hypothetical protein